MKILCQKCQKKPAVFYYEQTINGSKSECALCAECAAEWKKSNHKEDDSLFFKKEASPFSGIDALFGSLFAPSIATGRKSKSCPLCLATTGDLRRTGKVGCAECYRVFAEELQPTLRSIHGTQTHTGREPASHQSENKKKKELEELKAKLNEAIAAQEFEEAARLRDKIKDLEKKA